MAPAPLTQCDPGDECDGAQKRAVLASTCEVCKESNAAVTVLWGMRLCGRASCLRHGLKRWVDAS